VRAAAGGNLGPPALGLSPLGAGEIYVLELSSYQLELLATASFNIAALINISPDHLDRHGDMAGYVRAKERIFAGAGRQASAVIAVDDDYTRRIADALAKAGGRELTRVALTGGAGDVTVKNGILYEAGQAAIDLNGVANLPGRHNWQNAAMAYGIARRLGLPGDTIAQYIPTYPGLPHRQELVAVIDGIRFINDSKATNAEAAARALDCYQTIYWIAGGLAKEGGLDGLEPWHSRIAEAFLVGAAADSFQRTLAGKVANRIAGDLATAVAMAHAAAQRDGRPDPVVLLSPACASFDQWPGFEARGNAFRQMVMALETAPVTRKLAS
jgi:UDP-N-acetylmuramoylalanine--D-glutamate ligase